MCRELNRSSTESNKAADIVVSHSEATCSLCELSAPKMPSAT